MYAPMLMTTGTDGGIFALLIQLSPMILLLILLWFIMIRPQRKREKAVQEMRSKLEIGDEITTIGGIIGRIVSMRDDSMVIETGSDRDKIRVARWSVQQNNTAMEKAQAEKAQAKAAKAAKTEQNDK